MRVDKRVNISGARFVYRTSMTLSNNNADTNPTPLRVKKTIDGPTDQVLATCQVQHCEWQTRSGVWLQCRASLGAMKRRL